MKLRLFVTALIALLMLGVSVLFLFLAIKVTPWYTMAFVLTAACVATSTLILKEELKYT